MVKRNADIDAVLRNVGNIANLSTPLGLLVAFLGRGRLSIVAGLVVAERVTLPGVTASAMTIGSVVLVPRQSLQDVQARVPGLLEHEDHHAHQWAYCLGLPFIVAYAVATGLSWVRSGDRATANFFEVQAGLALGGYPTGSRPDRGSAPLSDAVARRNAQPGAGTATDAGA